jgi:Ribonuclease G/E
VSIRATLCIDNAVGERRRALLDPFGRPFRLDIERWSERGRPHLDEIWWGRVKARTPGAKGWFVDLGLERDGVIEATRSGAMIEGALVPVRIKSEPWADKGAALSLADMPAATPRPDRPGLHAPPSADPFRAGVEIIATIEGAPARKEIDAAIEEAMRIEVSLPEGGDLAIERTRALTAIDVDAGNRAGREGEAFVLDLNLAAADEAARQVALRGLGGLVVVDFLSMANRKDRAAVTDAFRKALAKWLSRASEVADISALGLCEASIARRIRPVADALAAPPDEREGLDAIRRLESEGRAARGAKLQARVSLPASRWLQADRIGWKAALADRIGARWTIEADERPPADRGGQPQVWSVR